MKREKLTMRLSAGITAGVVVASASDAHAAGKAGFDTATNNIITASSNVPGLVTTVAYIAGIALGVLGVLKLKGHVDNPGNVPLKDGLVRLGAGGALLAFPFLLDSMVAAIGTTGGGGVTSAAVQGNLDAVAPIGP